MCYVEENKASALLAEECWARTSGRKGLRIYSDGSDIDGGVGAAAVLMGADGTVRDVLHYHLGSSRWHTVPEAETVGLVLGAELLRKLRAGAAVLGASTALDNKGKDDSSVTTP
ncbi:hypothetical protein BD413DRAFT_616942 [Trametes elegans]|nr:hypothetical protein BD413DRAFT_616942 [Trametes elegans]